MPSLLRESATVHLADGTYREQVYMTGKTVIGDATITILGNVTTPSSVRVTGADPGNETLAVRDYGFHVDDQRDLLITGVLFDYCRVFGVFATESSVHLIDCELDHDGEIATSGGGLRGYYSIIHATRVHATDNYTGLYVMRGSTLVVTDCTVEDNSLRGIALEGNLYGWLQGCFVDGTTNTGVFVASLSSASFYSSVTTISNNGVGVHSQTGSVANTGSGYWVSYSGNTSNTQTETGGQIY